jgi:hypothetical protein
MPFTYMNNCASSPFELESRFMKAKERFTECFLVLRFAIEKHESAAACS